MIKIACDLTTVKCTKDARMMAAEVCFACKKKFTKMLKPQVQAVVTPSCFRGGVRMGFLFYSAELPSLKTLYSQIIKIPGLLFTHEMTEK